MTELRFENDAALSLRCMDVLVRNVGFLETERFIAYLSRESMDYTEWRQGQFEDLSLEELGCATRRSGELVRERLRVKAALERLSEEAVPKQS